MTTLSPGAIAPAFTLPDVRGGEVRLDDIVHERRARERRPRLSISARTRGS